MDFLQQVQKDLDNGVLISPVTWQKVLATALEQSRANRLLAAALRTLFDDYKRGADSGDWGNWSLEDQPAGKQALEALAAEGAK